MEDEFKYKQEDVSQEIDISQPSKNGDRFKLVRLKTVSKIIPRVLYAHYCNYYIVNDKGIVVGGAPVTLNQNSHEATMDYWIKEEFQGQGIGSLMLKSVVEDVLNVSKPLNNLTFLSKREPNVDSSCVDSILLEINNDNYASRRIAEKNGFVKHANGKYIITTESLSSQFMKNDEFLKKL